MGATDLVSAFVSLALWLDASFCFSPEAEDPERVTLLSLKVPSWQRVGGESLRQRAIAGSYRKKTRLLPQSWRRRR